jgi:sec-independent protein translocase protein TatA
MLSQIGIGELLVVFAVVLLLFGPKRIPELASALGRSIRNFRQGLKENSDAENTPSSDKKS